MELRFWGVRGTFPVMGKAGGNFGGNTACASLKVDRGEVIVIDAGTGLKYLGDALLKEKGEKALKIHLLFTHFHLDHIIGLPFFAPLFSPRVLLTFYSTAAHAEMERCLSGLMAGRFFPVDFNDTQAKKVFRMIEGESLVVAGVHISLCPLTHPQGSVAFRLEGKKENIVFATDTEHPLKGIDTRLAAFARGASNLVYDATFTPQEYEASRRGWGHSTWLEGTKLAREAGVRNLFLSHFNPDHSDRKLEGIIAAARKEFWRTRGAREGLKINL